LLFAGGRLFFFLLLLRGASDAHALDRVQVKGNQLIAAGKPIRLQGTNLGNWLLREDFMFGLHGTHSQMQEAMEAALGKKLSDAFWDEYERTYFQDADAQFLKQQRYNILRVPLNQNRFEDPNAPGKYDPHGLAKLDNVVRIAGAHGIYVMLDLHALPGGQSREIYADSKWATAEFWDSVDNRRRATDFWVALAKRYRSNPVVMGYDLVNEPNTEGRPQLLTQWIEDTSAAIRKVDPSGIIIISGDDWGKGFLGLKDSMWNDPQTMFQFHIYPSFTYPMAKMTRYPATVEGVTYDIAWLRKHLANKIAFERRPVLLGEFGLSFNGGKLDLLQAMMKDLLEVSHEEGWHWAQWSYKDVGQMGLRSPRADTPWKRFLASPEVRAERKKVHRLYNVRGVEEKGEALLPDAINSLHEMNGSPVQRGFLLNAQRVVDKAVSFGIASHLKGKTEAELRELARSFSFESTQRNSELLGVFEVRK
jgi:hypothetical protein